MDAADLGPISPELALIDPNLARRARELLPEPRERPRPRAAPAPLSPPPPEPEVAPARRRRLAPTLVLAALIFGAGLAASGSIVAPQHVASPGATLDVRTVAPPVQRQPKRQTTVQPASHPRRRAHSIWASNLLGVVTKMSRHGVTLVWHRPANSGRVVVLRSRGRGRSHVVYHGRGTRYEDRSLRPCTTYRYTLVSYDRRGHRSTGVSSSVVTAGCT